TVGGGGTQSTETNNGSFTNAGNCTDNAGNVASSNTFSPIMIDLTKPNVSSSISKGGTSTGCEYPTGSTAWYSTTNSNGNSCGSGIGNFTVTATADDASGTVHSGVHDVAFPALSGFSGGGDVSSPGPYTATYGWTTSTATSPSSNATASDAA